MNDQATREKSEEAENKAEKRLEIAASHGKAHFADCLLVFSC